MKESSFWSEMITFRFFFVKSVAGLRRVREVNEGVMASEARGSAGTVSVLPCHAVCTQRVVVIDISRTNRDVTLTVSGRAVSSRASIISFFLLT